jgi:ABC-type multidrug transport system fused ATPase/permease subunit|tara:strand:- start:22088 stop:23806 length:1719 start_codon:yes stop_codon:yes gene_type:complete
MKNFSKLWILLNNKLRKNFFFLLIVIFFSTLLEMLSVSLIIPFLTIILDEKAKLIDFLYKYNFQSLENLVNIESIIVIFFLIYLVKNIFKFFVVHFKNDYVYTFFSDLIQKLFKNYLYKDYLFHKKNNSAKLMRNLLSEIHQVSIGYFGSITNIILESITILGMFAILLIYDPKISLIFFIFSGFVALSIVLILKKKSKKLGKDRQKFSLINIKNIMQSLGGIKEILINCKENEVIDFFNKNIQKVKHVNYLFAVINEIPKILLEFVILSSLLVLAYFLINKNYDIAYIITYFALLVAASSRVLPSINRLSTSIISLNFYKPSLDLIIDELSDYNTTHDLKINNDKSFEEIKFDKFIEIKNLHFSYSENVIFKNLNMKITKGEKIGIVGESGSGKSTLVDIIIGLLKSEKGTITVDDKDIHENIYGWYKLIGYVPQEVFINDDNLKNNIVYYENPTEFDSFNYNQSIYVSQLKKYIHDNDIGNFYNLGERGQNLSGGQKQRVGLARAIYKNSEVLIFDESTNALDDETETKFLNDVYELKNDKTIIVISHDQNVLKKCDKIFKIENKTLINV